MNSTWLRSLLIVAFAAFPWVVSGDEGPLDFWGFGISAASLGDIDGDGRAEFVVGAPHKPSVRFPDAGHASALSGAAPYLPRFVLLADDFCKSFVGRTLISMGDIEGDGAGDFASGGLTTGFRMVSGRDGHTLHEVGRDALPDGWWIDLRRSGATDVDGDGVSDLVTAIGLWNAEPGTVNRGVAVFSGADGCMIRFARWTDWLGFGAAGDVDSDGCGDILVSRDNSWNAVPTEITFRVLSGRDLHELRQFTFSSPSSELHVVCAPLRDAYGDGIADLAIGLTDDSYDWSRDSGRVVIVSGKDGSTLRTLDDGGAWNLFGYSVADAGDVDFDGCSDIIVGSYMDLWRDLRRGSILLFSGKTGALIRRWAGSEAAPVGVFVGAAGDLNCDGFPDQFASAVEDQNEEYWNGSLFLLSGFDGTVLARLGSADHRLLLVSR